MIISKLAEIKRAQEEYKVGMFCSELKSNNVITDDIIELPQMLFITMPIVFAINNKPINELKKRGHVNFYGE
jgi:hypothetical protein